MVFIAKNFAVIPTPPHLLRDGFRGGRGGDEGGRGGGVFLQKQDHVFLPFENKQKSQRQAKRPFIVEMLRGLARRSLDGAIG